MKKIFPLSSHLHWSGHDLRPISIHHSIWSNSFDPTDTHDQDHRDHL